MQPKSQKNSVFNTILESLSFQVKLIFVFLLLLIYFALFLVNSRRFTKLNTRFRLLLTPLIKVPTYLNKPWSFLPLLFLLFSVYFSFSKSMFSNNLNTQSILLNTENIIQTKKDLLASQYSVCWLRDETEYHLTERAPKGNYLSKVFSKSLIYDPATGGRKVCFVGKNAEALDLVGN